MRGAAPHESRQSAGGLRPVPGISDTSNSSEQGYLAGTDTLRDQSGFYKIICVGVTFQFVEHGERSDTLSAVPTQQLISLDLMVTEPRLLGARHGIVHDA